MKKVESEALKKEFKKITNNLIIGIVFIALSIVCLALIFYNEKKDIKDTTYLNDVIENQDNKEDVKANLKVAKEPYKFAYYSDATDKGYYVIDDGEYFYIAYMSNSDCNELKTKDLENNPETIYGVTKKVNSDIIKNAVAWYNKGLTADKKITTSQFEDYFGGVYLDTTSNSSMFVILVIVEAISGICAFSFILVYIIRNRQAKKMLKNIPEDELSKIEKEIDSKDAFHYERAHLILTNNYIISFSSMSIMKIKDIFWIYEHRLRQNGITTQKSLFVLNKDGKTKSIMTVDGVTKKSTAVLQEIMETIANKDESILVGYTKENQNKASELLKKIKEKKKQEKKEKKNNK